jgi:hypothetical protein
MAQQWGSLQTFVFASPEDTVILANAFSKGAPAALNNKDSSRARLVL